MIATHRVRDSSNKTIGFIINGTFFTDYFVSKNIDSVENLSITKSGVIRGKRELPIAYYESITNSYYKELIKQNPFEREIQSDFLQWKKSTLNQVIQVDGARQVGKTTEILKFAYKYYEYIIYVNLADDAFNFIDNVINQGSHILAMEAYCRNANLPHYVDNKRTILIIDEIQLSPKVYNSIRLLNKTLKCDIIVTGSYLGRILGDKRFFLAAGTVQPLNMFPLSFKEFCGIFKADKLLETISLFGKSSKEAYNKLEGLYELYKQIGGYPAVVKEFVKTKQIDNCYNQIEKLLNIFEDESKFYFSNPRETLIFNTIYIEAIKEMIIDKRGTGNRYIDTVVKIANQSRNQKTIVTREEVLKAIEWLIYCGIIGRSHLYLDGDKRNMVSSRRTYYIDCGIANYIAKKAKLIESDKDGLLTETFAYGELLRLCKKDYINKVVNEDLPSFSVVGDYELDFMILDKNNKAYGIEVKTTTGDPKSLKYYLNKGLIDEGVVAKRTTGGHGDRFDTIPIYAVGARFPYK